MRRYSNQGRWNRPTSSTSNYNWQTGQPSSVGRPSTSDVEHLKQLYNKSNEDVLTEFSHKSTDFLKWIQGGDVGEKMYFLIGILSKIISSPFNIHKGTILTKLCKGEFFKELFSCIMLLPAHSESEKKSNQTLWSNMDKFWTNLIIFCSSLFDVVPTNAIDIVSKLISTAQLTFSNLERQSFKIADEVKEQLTLLEKQLQIRIDDMEEKRKCPVVVEPPNDFRQIPVYPTSKEILQCSQPFLRENKVVGSYRDVNEYLDIQFRLLREDYVKPLREGINEYMMQQSGAAVKKRILSVKVYKNVTLLEVVYVNGEIGRKVQLFDKHNNSNRKYNSKRLMYGSLVCFTKDYFKTLIFGRITCTDATLLKQGQIIVHFEANAEETSKAKYVMVECGIYFEPYYVVLTALQQLEVARFPLKQFIVDTCTTVNCPNYLREIQQGIPGEQSSQLNNKQYEAFTMALSKELVIIQGPPGTGKTHLGLKIVKTILQLEERLSSETNVSGPILVLCYTNHALDQFLEGILNFTRKIVRVGGQSKNVKLKGFNLKEVYRHQRARNALLETKRGVLINTALEIKKFNCLFDVMNHCGGVVDFKEFQNIEPEFRNSWFYNKTSDEILYWLCGGIDRRSYIDQRELINNSLREDEHNMFDTSRISETNSYENKIDDTSMIIEIHSAFDEINSKVIHLNLTYDISEIQLCLKEMASDLEREKEKFIKSDVKDRNALGRMHCLQLNIEHVDEAMNYIQLRLFEGKQWKINNKPEKTDLIKPNKMSAIDRWRLYFYWLHLYKIWAEERVNHLVEKYLVELKEYEEQKAIEDVKLMRNHDVIGMTTTGAARIQSTLQALKCPIVVVEEAAEILESHVVTSVTEHCQHLILIGDHQQLRPTTADYSMEKNMKLGVSLFERFIINKFEYSRLNIQHRMRPEISSLIYPAIYPDLVDHPSVLNYPHVKGMDRSVYFIDHSEQEVTFGDSSKQNPHEAKFLVRLAQHLLYNGYAPTDITILVAYLGQYYTVMDEMRSIGLHEEVRCAVLDNYQGEESKIILLSLVRNNKDNSIGFLKIENRVCVALSRAKEGLYIMGNMELLCRNSKVWPKIKDALLIQNSLGEYLLLRCQNHTEHTVKVKSHSDFEKARNGCCGQICGFELRCGHKCKLLCHLKNSDHMYKCEQQCLRALCDNESHLCQKLCSQKCGLCKYSVEQTLNCGHVNTVPCYKTWKIYLNQLTCQCRCDIRFEKCGHVCNSLCHVNKDPEHKEHRCMQRCSKDAANCSLDNEKHRCKNKCYMECQPCSEMVEKRKVSCKHVIEVPCSKNVDDSVYYCSYPCDKLLQCGHSCDNQCGESCNSFCEEIVEKIFSSCGHKIMCQCGDNDFQQNFKCEKIVDTTVFAACGHKFKVPCYLKQLQLPQNDRVLLSLCPERCMSVLACGHTCTGTCVTCFQGRFHKACTVPCEKSLVCGHKCELTCGKPCEPYCSQKCSFSCVHGDCDSLCGERCLMCNKKCPRACKHARCFSKCGNQVCTVPPCEEPCCKVFDCGHRCIGFCGDVCPTRCYICSGEAIKNNVNYVVLQECGHAFEVDEMKRLLEEQNTIGIKLCPICKVRLSKTHRIKDYMKEGTQQQQAIMKKVYNVDRGQQVLSINESMSEFMGGIIYVYISTATDNACFDFKKKIIEALNISKIEAMSKNFVTKPIKGRDTFLRELVRGLCKTEILEFFRVTKTSIFDSVTFSLQESVDVLNEFKRCLNKLGLICILSPILQDVRIESSFLDLFENRKTCLNDEQKEKTRKLINLLYSVREFSDDDNALARSLLKSLDSNNTLEEIIPEKELGLPDDIISYDRDSWFKCSQGHLNPCDGKNNDLKQRSCKICDRKQDEDEENEKNFYRGNRRMRKYKEQSRY